MKATGRSRISKFLSIRMYFGCQARVASKHWADKNISNPSWSMEDSLASRNLRQHAFFHRLNDDVEAAVLEVSEVDDKTSWYLQKRLANGSRC